MRALPNFAVSFLVLGDQAKETVLFVGDADRILKAESG
jgi:hypothetical protein